MHGNANLERTRTKRRFCQFTRTASTMDLRLTEYDRKLAERKRQCERYEARHGTAGKRSEFGSLGNVSGTPRQRFSAGKRAFL